MQLTKSEFERLIKPFVEKTIQCCKNALLDAGVNKDEIDEVIMVGAPQECRLLKKQSVNRLIKIA